MKKNKTKDYYKILNVPKKATKSEIRRAYTKLAKKYHPDRNRSSKEETEEAA
jgi:DnaJ-class molecular chaperone